MKDEEADVHEDRVVVARLTDAAELLFVLEFPFLATSLSSVDMLKVIPDASVSLFLDRLSRDRRYIFVVVVAVVATSATVECVGFGFLACEPPTFRVAAGPG